MITYPKSHGWSTGEPDLQSRWHCLDLINLIKTCSGRRKGREKVKSRLKKRFIAEKIGRSLSDVEWKGHWRN